MPAKSSTDPPNDDISSLTKSGVAKKRFIDSMAMNHEKWHDGIGYDLAALDEMTQSDKEDIEQLLISNQSEPWHNFEALQYINTPSALAAIKDALGHPTLGVRIAASRFAKSSDLERERILIEALKAADFYGGLTQALDQVESFHPPGIIDALLRGLLKRSDSAAVNFAAMLFYLHGKAESSFDWNHRPFFLKFSTEDPNQRKQAFTELCDAIGANPQLYLDGSHNLSGVDDI